MNDLERWWERATRDGADVARVPTDALDRAIARAVSGLDGRFRPAWMLRVECSDRGQHKPITIGVIARSQGAAEYEFGTDTSKRRPDGVLDLDPKHGDPVSEDAGFGRLVTWSCARCTRRTPWTWANAQEHAGRLEAMWPHERLDMSFF